jgi:putative transcriptional regulator
MRKSVKEAIGATVQDMLRSGLNSSFTKKELDSLGVKTPKSVITPAQIREMRKKTNLTEIVFAKLLNVSPSSVRQWEQGIKTPKGSAKVLLELLNQSPHLLDYRIGDELKNF